MKAISNIRIPRNTRRIHLIKSMKFEKDEESIKAFESPKKSSIICSCALPLRLFKSLLYSVWRLRILNRGCSIPAQWCGWRTPYILQKLNLCQRDYSVSDATRRTRSIVPSIFNHAQMPVWLGGIPVSCWNAPSFTIWANPGKVCHKWNNAEASEIGQPVGKTIKLWWRLHPSTCGKQHVQRE